MTPGEVIAKIQGLIDELAEAGWDLQAQWRQDNQASLAAFRHGGYDDDLPGYRVALEPDEGWTIDHEPVHPEGWELALAERDPSQAPG